MPLLRLLPFLALLPLLLLHLLVAAGEAGQLYAMATARGRVKPGGLTGSMEEMEMEMESEASRRMLANAAGQKYISYDVLKKNDVPCNQRGQSYYNCQAGARVNPYHRACTAITNCARVLN